MRHHMHKVLVSICAVLALMMGLAVYNPVSAVAAENSTNSRTMQELEKVNWSEVKRVFDAEMQSRGYLDEIQEVRDLHASLKQERGPKTLAAKAALKAALKTLKHIGKRSWDATINKLPLPVQVKRFLGYDILFRAINIGINLQGMGEDFLTKGLSMVGVPEWIAGPVVRAAFELLL
ncbi:hypothetical protein B9G54_05670 [Alloscardovia macacae]|nr:hypothetical protein [Alloscardovia macacae]OTA26170.1 hypothetical protein B9G54_05670 [Alloscardovia macacae]